MNITTINQNHYHVSFLNNIIIKETPFPSGRPDLPVAISAPPRSVRGWRNTVEVVLFEISNSMKPYPSVLHARTSKSRLAMFSCRTNKYPRRFRPYSVPPRSAYYIYIYIYVYICIHIIFYIYMYVYVYIDIYI